MELELAKHPRWAAVRTNAHELLKARLDRIELLYELMSRSRGFKRLRYRIKLKWLVWLVVG